MTKTFNTVPDEAKSIMLEVCATYGGVERSSEYMTLGDFCEKFIVSEPDLKKMLEPERDDIDNVLAINAGHDRVNEAGSEEPFKRFLNGTIDLTRKEDWDFVWEDCYGEGFMLNIYFVRPGNKREW